MPSPSDGPQKHPSSEPPSPGALTPPQSTPSLSLEEKRRALLDLKAIADSHYPGGYAALEDAAYQAARAQKEALDRYQATQNTLASREGEWMQALHESRELQKQIDTHEERLIPRIIRALRLRDRHAEALEQKSSDLEKHTAALQSEMRQLRNVPYPHYERESHPEQVLAEISRPLFDSKLSPDEISRLLTDDVVASLSLPEFIAMWRRLDPRYLSHVVRQGVRDHYAMFYHSAGMGEFHDGMRALLDDEQTLRPPMIASHGLRDRSPESVKRFLMSWVLQAPSAEEAHERLHRMLHDGLASAPPYPDKTAVHFAADEVADDYYGAETHNCPFLLFPAALVASRYPFGFNGREKTFDRQSERKWNDVFVWADKGIPCDLAIVFLPLSTRVDPRTGSRYRLNPAVGAEPQTVVLDEELPRRFREWGKSLGEPGGLGQALREYTSSNSNGRRTRAPHPRLFECVRQALNEIGVERLDACFLADAIILYAARSIIQEGEGLGDDAEHFIKRHHLGYARAEHTISAKEFWEAHFSRYPEQRPKRVVYYDGDPSDAVLRFQQEHNIDTNIGVSEWNRLGDGIGYYRKPKPTEPPLLGFDQNYVADMWADARVWKGLPELKDLSRTIIDSYYGRDGMSYGA